jgi:hypothetical protein
MSFTNIISDLREKRLWPVAALLLVALVAIPLLLSTSSPPAPARATPAVLGAVVTAPGTAVPAVSLSTSAQVSRLTGKARDPFTQQATPVVVLPPTNTNTTTTAPPPPNGGGGGGGGGGGKSTQVSDLETVTKKTPPKKPVNGLSPTQSYHVVISITNALGGFDRIDPLERLGGVPSNHQPLLVYIGVLQGGKRVLFAVAPGAVLSGPGTCTPGPIDCEILSLGLDQIEGLSTHAGTSVVPAAEFAVTTIDANQHPSVAAANKARGTVSAAGRALLAKWALPALSLFPFESSVGAVVDQRDLTVGGS